LSAPGDLVRVRVVERRKRFARAEIDALLEPGPDRRSPPCEVHGRCGGCSWQHLAYPAQLVAKRRILGDALRRIGGIDLDDDPPITASPRELGYRGRTRLLARAGGLGYRERRSHRLCPVTRCPVLVPELEAALEQLATQLSDRTPASGEQEWTLAVGASGATRAALLDMDGPPRIVGSPELALQVGEDSLLLSPGSFSQANALLLDALHTAVTEAATRGARVLELFAGAGFFTLALARRFEHVVAVESSPSAVRDLRTNLEAAGLEAEVIEHRVEDVLASSTLERPDVVVLDPPRAGLAAGAAIRLAALGASRIVYLSCDPATLARDLAVLIAEGYALDGMRGFDLFPQTPHVEALAILSRDTIK
jgi:23S rRNA (uracil1939-C5)-methyltransferase